jgi:hypothetical protein
MPKGDVETFHKDDQWHSKIEGEAQPFASTATKEEAVQAGRERARELKVEHIIKGQDGRIHERNTYGHDPRSSRG